MARLVVGDIDALRASSILPHTETPGISSEPFKSALSKAKRPSKQLDHHFSSESREFGGSALRKATALTGTRKVIALGAGRPMAEYFPWESLTFEGSSPTAHGTLAVQAVRKQEGSYDVEAALNYGNSVGSPQLVRFITEHVEIVHNPPYADWSVCLSCGNTAAMEMSFRIFCNKGDVVLTEKYTFPGALAAASLVGMHVEGVDMDADGLRPDHLDDLLSGWDESRAPKPTLLYTIPTGQNPTGGTQSLERRKKVYQVADKHDLIIIEDDPYYFLRLGRYSPENNESSNETIDSLEDKWPVYPVPSYLSLDQSGRVVRLDSASKILAPGLRAGWITASAQIINKYKSYHETSTVSVNGPTQLMLCKLLDESWGHQGFFSWLNALSRDYRSRRNIFLKACYSYLPKQTTSWVVPQHGMFILIEVDWRSHPRLADVSGLSPRQIDGSLAEIETAVVSAALDLGVQVTKGSLFTYNKRPNGVLGFRLTFGAAPKSELDQGVKLFADAVRSEFLLSLEE